MIYIMYSAQISYLNYTYIGLLHPFCRGYHDIKDSVSLIFPQLKHFVSLMETYCFSCGNTLFLLFA